MRFVRGDVRDHIVSHKIDHGPSHRRYSALQRQRRLKINFREIFGIVRFSTFSARSGHSTTDKLSIICLSVATDSILCLSSVPDSVCMNFV